MIITMKSFSPIFLPYELVSHQINQQYEYKQTNSYLLNCFCYEILTFTSNNLSKSQSIYKKGNYRAGFKSSLVFSPTFLVRISVNLENKIAKEYNFGNFSIFLLNMSVSV